MYKKDNRLPDFFGTPEIADDTLRPWEKMAREWFLQREKEAAEKEDLIKIAATACIECHIDEMTEHDPLVIMPLEGDYDYLEGFLGEPLDPCDEENLDYHMKDLWERLYKKACDTESDTSMIEKMWGHTFNAVHWSERRAEAYVDEIRSYDDPDDTTLAYQKVFSEDLELSDYMLDKQDRDIRELAQRYVTKLVRDEVRAVLAEQWSERHG